MSTGDVADAAHRCPSDCYAERKQHAPVNLMVPRFRRGPMRNGEIDNPFTRPRSALHGFLLLGPECKHPSLCFPALRSHEAPSVMAHYNSMSDRNPCGGNAPAGKSVPELSRQPSLWA